MKKIFKITYPNPWKILPQTTGVYYFLNSYKKPVYIGKANNLQERVKQHFKDRFNPKERVITGKSVYLAWEILPTEFEALLLEANLVYRLQPKYNAALKDDKSPLYIVISKEEYPKVQIIRKTNLPEKYRFIFGPLVNNYSARNLLRQIRRIIPFCSEKKLGHKPCFYSHLGLCNPCPNVISHLSNLSDLGKEKKKYKKNIAKIIRLLKGNGRSLVNDLKKEMLSYSKQEKYEEAINCREKIRALEELFKTKFIDEDKIADPNYLEYLRNRENQELSEIVAKNCQVPFQKLKRIEGYDISNLNFQDAVASMAVFQNGQPEKKDYRRFKIKGRTRFDPEMLREVLERRLKHKEWQLPDLIVIDGGTLQVLGVYPLLKKQYPSLPPILGIAKNPDRLFCAQTASYIKLDKNSLALHYLERLRDEAHRFAKKYHMVLRGKKIPNPNFQELPK